MASRRWRSAEQGKDLNMSHFSVCVRLPASVDAGCIAEEVAKALLPYKERGCGDKDPPELQQYLVFDDCTDEVLSNWEEPGQKAKYGDVTTFAVKYHGYTFHDGKWGRWHNPNQKWDWYQIGGRWSGMLPVRSGGECLKGERSWVNESDPVDLSKADIARIDAIDWDQVALEGAARLEEFWRSWQRFCDGELPKDGNPFSGPRSTALDIGLVDCKDADQLTGDEWKTIKWERQIRPGVDRFDVLTKISEEEFRAKFAAYFSPIRAYATLDTKAGWQEPGEMGWFGFSAATPDARLNEAAGQLGWLRNGDQRDWVVIVDCHI